MLEARIIKALGTLALLVMEDAVYIPVFERLEQELADLRSRNDVIERARQFLATNHQNAMR
jgi:FtsZ-binding cell division protein ZapB